MGMINSILQLTSKSSDFGSLGLIFCLARLICRTNVVGRGRLKSDVSNVVIILSSTNLPAGATDLGLLLDGSIIIIIIIII